MNTEATPANVGSMEGLGILVERLRDCLPMVSDGQDHKTWCSVLGSDLRSAVVRLELLCDAKERPVIAQPARHGYI